MQKRIVQFILEQTCATICCVDEQGRPWCFSCFYAFNSSDGLIYFKSSPGSHHAHLLKINPVIAGTILPVKLSKLQVKGIQFDGVVLDASHPFNKKASVNYYKKYPVALAMQGEIMVIQINHIKMTDNTVGFGTKVTWNRFEQLACNHQ